MTDPVVLLGTQSNGETLPVQVNELGQLVAEGLQGQQGPEGPTGPEGPPGPPGIELPPDPYEGALLGWLNGGLAWIGTPPVPIPEDVFGPILAWDSNTGLLTVEGPIPSSVGNGVNIFQCTSDGTLYTTGYDVTNEWSSMVTNSEDVFWNNPPTNGFNGNLEQYIQPGNLTANIIFTNDSSIGTLSVWADGRSVPQKIEVYSSNYPDGISRTTTSGQNAELLTFENIGILNRIEAKGRGTQPAGLNAIAFGAFQLLDPQYSLGMRVNQLFSETQILGVPNLDVDFEVGAYLKIPEQRVAPWVLYGNDPTSLIDHLRRE